MSKISVYLPEALETQLIRQVKEKGLSASRVIQEALDRFLITDRKKQAKEDVLTLLAKVSFEPWEEVHRERTADDAGRR